MRGAYSKGFQLTEQESKKVEGKLGKEVTVTGDE